MTEPNDPTTIDWPERQARALIPFGVENGRPFITNVPGGWIHGQQIEVQRGRNGLPLWGENPEAAALVTCTYAGRRWVLLVQRRDDGTWAMPGGPIEESGQTYVFAAYSCARQAGFDLIDHGWYEQNIDEPCWVPDLRGSMEAWVVLVPVRFDLGEVEVLPKVRGRWFEISILMNRGRTFWPAHREILAGVR